MLVQRPQYAAGVVLFLIGIVLIGLGLPGNALLLVGMSVAIVGTVLAVFGYTQKKERKLAAINGGNATV